MVASMRASMPSAASGYWQLRLFQAIDPLPGQEAQRTEGFRGGKRDGLRAR